MACAALLEEGGVVSCEMGTELMSKALASKTTFFHHWISIVKAQHESMIKGLFCHLATPRFEGWPVDFPVAYWQSISELQNHSCQMLSLGRLLSFRLAFGLCLGCLGHGQLTIGSFLIGFAFQPMGPQRWPQQPSTTQKIIRDVIGNLLFHSFWVNCWAWTSARVALLPLRKWHKWDTVNLMDRCSTWNWKLSQGAKPQHAQVGWRCSAKALGDNGFIGDICSARPSHATVIPGEILQLELMATYDMCIIVVLKLLVKDLSMFIFFWFKVTGKKASRWHETGPDWLQAYHSGCPSLHRQSWDSRPHSGRGSTRECSDHSFSDWIWNSWLERMSCSYQFLKCMKFQHQNCLGSAMLSTFDWISLSLADLARRASMDFDINVSLSCFAAPGISYIMKDQTVHGSNEDVEIIYWARADWLHWCAQSCFSTSASGVSPRLPLPGGLAVASASDPRSMAAGSSRDTAVNSTGLPLLQSSSSSLTWVYFLVSSPDSSTSR